jgi:hypothetical protein
MIYDFIWSNIDQQYIAFPRYGKSECDFYNKWGASDLAGRAAIGMPQLKKVIDEMMNDYEKSISLRNEIHEYIHNMCKTLDPKHVEAITGISPDEQWIYPVGNGESQYDYKIQITMKDINDKYVSMKLLFDKFSYLEWLAENNWKGGHVQEYYNYLKN